MKKIRFCHVIDAATPNPLLFNSVRYSDHTQFEYIVISLAPAGGLQEQMKSIGVHSFSLNYTSKWKSLSAIWKLYRYFRKEKIQIVQTHLFKASLMGLFAARLARVPLTIFTGHHSHEVPLYKKKLLTFIDGISGRWLSKKTIAPSHNMKDIFMSNQKIPAGKIEVIHHGFDLDDWRKKANGNIKAEFGIEDKIVFGAVGRLFWVKDFETLITAFATVAGNNDNAVLLIAGDGPDKENLQQLAASKNVNDKVIFAGRRTDIAAVMNSFDVFVHTSIAESFGMVYIEAFALGKPAISTPVGIAPDIITNGVNGFVAKTGDAASFSNAMFQLLAIKDKWPQMSERNKKIADDFAVQKTQALCDSFYLKWMEKQ